jgi:N-dimethylarginine dimethylaminohydrolase
MYYPAAFDRESQRKIEERFPKAKRICVSEADALRFACNAINIGTTILLNQIGTELSAQLQSLGYKVIQVDLTEFMKAGGAAKCLVLRLNETDATARA